jgi:hypothetical protein
VRVAAAYDQTIATLHFDGFSWAKASARYSELRAIASSATRGCCRFGVVLVFVVGAVLVVVLLVVGGGGGGGGVDANVVDVDGHGGPSYVVASWALVT